MEYAICTVAAAPVRKEAAHRSEMVNQLLFGETMQVLDQKEEWLLVRSSYDDYEGWLTDHLVTPIQVALWEQEVRFYATLLTNPVTMPDQLINAPMGAALTGFDEETRLLWDERYKYHGTYRSTDQPFNMDLLIKTTHAWINAPYLWGGKTFMGVDCSGFVQTVFKVQGIRLKRDAWQQADQGKPVDGLSQARQGDIVFFCNENGRVTHVGIVLDGGRIVHASGKVRIDTLDEKGIMNQEKGKHTHTFHSLRRVL